MYDEKTLDDLFIESNTSHSYFDLCSRKNLRVSVTYRVGGNLETCEGYITGYHPEIFMFSLKSEDEAHDYTIPIKNVELITV